jgi:hypothetical protein
MRESSVKRGLEIALVDIVKDRRIKALAQQEAVKSDAGHILGKSN